ncbi:MAG: AAA family ATPase [Gammaproteobacteria bacterium]
MKVGLDAGRTGPARERIVTLSTLKPRTTTPHHQALRQLLDAASEVILGKAGTVHLAVTCLVAGGHLLLEDLPGVGKTTLAHTLARLSGLTFQRIQFTSDMLPADILGASVFDRDAQRFVLQRGPVFTQVLLADEINRATPRAQSALLEAMEERQVTLEGITHDLPRPFFVIATQNPREQVGTYPLPESQLDRFLMRLSLGYPDRGAERALLRGQDRRELLGKLAPLLTPETVVELQLEASRVHVADPLLDYLQALLAASRASPDCAHGLSPRAGLALLRAAQAWAFVDGRTHCVPDDLQAVLPSVVGHRLVARDPGMSGAALAARLIASVPVP